MEKKFVLNVENAILPEWWPSTAPSTLPVAPGEHQYAVDLLEDEIPESIYAEFVSSIAKFNPNGDRSMPIGFPLEAMPVGSKIERIK